MSAFYNYDEYVQDALRSVVLKILKRVEKEGILGNHNFYITFKTHYNGVIMPDYLKQKHPDEITIVIQYQFWNLKTTEDSFSISLSFNGKQENLTIPLKSIVSFVDPYVKFGLQFVVDENNGYSKIDLRNEQNKTNNSDSHETSSDETNTENESPKEDKEDVVVSLDEFRKKKQN